MEIFFKLLKRTNEVEKAKMAIDKGDFTELNEALENDSNIDDIVQILDYAIKNSDEKTIKENIDIITSKIDPKKKDQIINAALERAFETKNPEIIKALLNNLQEPEPKSLENLLIKALKLGNTEIIKQLLDKGAEVSEQNIDGLIEIVISAKNKNFYPFKDIVKLLTEKLTKDTTKLLEELRPTTKQNELYEQLEKNLKQLKELEELKENKEQKAEPSQDIQAIENLIKAVRYIEEGKLPEASHHLKEASNSKGNPDFKKIANELKDNLQNAQKIENHESVGQHTEKVNSQQTSLENSIEIG